MSFLLLKQVHVTAAILSASGFVVRGMLMWVGSPLNDRIWVRRVPHVIDTILLGAAIAMLWVGQRDPFAEPWLGSKIGWLLAYIGFGALALKRAPTLRARRICFGVAILLLAHIFTIALTRNAGGLPALVMAAAH